VASVAGVVRPGDHVLDHCGRSAGRARSGSSPAAVSRRMRQLRKCRLHPGPAQYPVQYLTTSARRRPRPADPANTGPTPGRRPLGPGGRSRRGRRGRSRSTTTVGRSRYSGLWRAASICSSRRRPAVACGFGGRQPGVEARGSPAAASRTCSPTGHGRGSSHQVADETSGVTGDCHAPFCGSPGVRFLRATRRAWTRRHQGRSRWFHRHARLARNAEPSLVS
jgi:hypothetical protein